MSAPDRPCDVCHRAESTWHITEWAVHLCSGCLPCYFEKKVKTTLTSLGQIKRGDRVMVGVSGGKDSAALVGALRALQKDLYFHLTAFYVDMGLPDYSAQCEVVIRQLCDQLRVPLEVLPLAKYGVHIEAVRKWPVCAVCGICRRALITRELTPDRCEVLATGHTLEDQLQYMVKNLISGRFWSPQPVLEATDYLPRKVKPLFFIPEAATAAYTEVRQLPLAEATCPLFVPESHSLKEVAQTLEQVAPGSKLIVLHNLRKLLKPRVEAQEWRPCADCGTPTPKQVCDLCRLRRDQEASKSL